MTVQQLLTGIPGPLSHAEYVRWIAFYRVKSSKEQQAQSRAKRSGSKGGRRR